MAAGAGPLRAFLRRRRDPVAATGLALTVALAVIIVGGVVIGVLAYLVRSSRSGLEADSAAARWGFRHATPFTDHVLDLITRLGDVYVVTTLAVVVAVVETIRVRSRYVIPFLVIVTLGNYLATVAIKDLTERARPTLNPIAASLGPSFPSGHTSTAAAFYAAVASGAAMASRLRRGSRAGCPGRWPACTAWRRRGWRGPPPPAPAAAR